jgi:membrane protease YdiL (CAAX protease family)
MGEPPPIDGPAVESALTAFGQSQPDRPSKDAPREQSSEGDASRSPDTGWPAWSAGLALLGGVVLASVAGLVLDIPAALIFGVKLSSEHFPPGLSIADTVVQDVAFVLVAVYCAQLGGRIVSSWQFGLRRPGAGWRRAIGLIVLLLIGFVVFSVIWSAIFHPKEETLLKQLGSNEGAALLVLSAGLTCVVAPICEEFLFRGYIFTSLRSWRGTLPAALITGLVFGGVHYGSAPTLDLVPLAGLGFGLCLLYRFTGSLYPCMVAHSLNNSVAFASLEGWGWQTPVLVVSSLLAIWMFALAGKRVGLIRPANGFARPGA